VTYYIINRDKLKATGRENREGRLFIVFGVSTFKCFGRSGWRGERIWKGGMDSYRQSDKIYRISLSNGQFFFI